VALENYIRRSGGGIEAADCLICPEQAGESYFRFHRREELVKLGAQAAQAQLPTISAATGWRPVAPAHGEQAGAAA
jgi:hypothetical protein